MKEVLDEFISSAIDTMLASRDTAEGSAKDLLVRPHERKDVEEDLEALKEKEKEEQVVYLRVRKVGGERSLREVELERSKDLRGWFSKFDRDGNGKVDKKEFSQALVEVGLSVTSKELEVLLSRFDEDGSGAIDYNEFEKFVSANGQDRFQEIEKILTMLKDPKRFNRGGGNRTWSLPCANNNAKLRDFHSQIVHGALTKSALAMLSKRDTTKL